MIKKYYPHLVILVFSFLWVAFSLFTYKNYGITADEYTVYTGGKMYIEYFKTGGSAIFENISSKNLPENSKHFRGYAALLGLFVNNGYYEWYHLLNMLFALSIFIFCYYLVYFYSKNVYFSLLSVVFLALTPRFFGNTPFNPKDTPFAVLYFISVGLIYIFSKVKKTNLAQMLEVVLLGLLFGLANSQRVVGVTLFVVYFMWNIICDLKNFKLVFLKSIVLALICNLVMLIIWPYYKTYFPESLKELYIYGKNFEYWNNTMLYFGNFLTKYQRPWHYLFVWLAIATPPFILLGDIFSFLYLKRNKLILLVWISIFLNLFIYLVMKPVIYNSLRHFLYLLPLISLASVLGFYQIFNKIKTKRNKILLSLPILLLMFITSFNMYKLHPLEYLYFNEVSGGLSKALGKFETDYWFASYKEASEWLVSYIDKQNLSSTPKVYSCNVQFAVLYYSKGKYTIADKRDNADFVLCDYDTLTRRSIEGKTLYTVKKLNVPINYVIGGPFYD